MTTAITKGWPNWREELTETIRLSLPIALTQLGQIAMMTTDLMLVGRLGDEAVAAAALGQTVLFATFVVGMGFVAAVAPLAAQAFGARAPRMVRRALRVGLWAALMLGVPLSLLQLWGEEILIALGQSPATASQAGRYLAGLAWCLVPGWWFLAIRGFMGAVNRPEPALWITLAAIPANFALAYALIFGEFGFPNLDLLGAGVATTVVNVAMCAIAIWVCYSRRPFRKYHVLGRFWRFDPHLFKELVVVGAPISASFALEHGLFACAALMMGWIGTSALAAHQIAIQIAAIMFMVPFGISMAATVRVGHAVGRGDSLGTRHAGFMAIMLGVVFMVVMTILVVLTRDLVPEIFLAADHASTQTLKLASTLLLVGTTFFIFDGLQTVTAGALRGLNDTRMPLVFAFIGFWLVGFPSAYVLGFTFHMGAVGVWIGCTLGILAFAALLLWRFHDLTAKGYLPAVTGANPIPYAAE